MTQILTVGDYVDAVSKTMALELIKLIDTQAEERGVEVGKAIVANFTAAFIAAATVRALGGRRESEIKDTKAQYEACADDFLSHKSRMQEAVAAGFSGALQEFSGKPVEYYCTIKIVPEPPSKSVN